jgi:alpha-amylase/alpha-mannosidase (GH57 family)
MSNRYLCIHGHFYQPPRENAWTGFIEAQPSASPYRDWNERITKECYTPNTMARILVDGGRIGRMLNNYEYMSFNFGPTLLSWLEVNAPETYNLIIEADEKSRERNNGHGNALAQVYNHIIMPLANERDRLTQIRWGLKDFEKRFGRPAEGMWLAETAVDTETLRLMAQEGVRFTILSPGQAGAVRPLGSTDDKWKDVGNGSVDPRRPYRVVFDSKKSPAHRRVLL